MILQRILGLYADLTQGTSHFPPTDLYNEGWLLRVIINWFMQSQTQQHPISLFANATWFSEARLPSAFLPRFRGDSLGESHTNADNVIGHFDIGKHGKADITLKHDVTQFVVLEAKIFSRLSKSTTNAPYFDQAARNIACIAEVLNRANRTPDQLHHIGFYVLAPEIQIQKGTFQDLLTTSSVKQKVKRRVEEYDGEKDTWHMDWFEPLIETIDIQAISWESIISFIKANDVEFAPELEIFYQNCLRFNG